MLSHSSSTAPLTSPSLSRLSIHILCSTSFLGNRSSYRKLSPSLSPTQPSHHISLKSPRLSLSSRRLPLPQHLLRLRSEEHTSELQSLMRTSYDVSCLKQEQK